MLSSVQNALQILKALSRSSGERGLTDLSRELHLGKSTTFRLVHTLMAEGMVAQNPKTGRFRLGLALAEMGNSAAEDTGLQRAGFRQLTQLHGRVNELVMLGVLDGPDVITIAKIECTRAVAVNPAVMRRCPGHCSAMGKAILTFLPPESLSSHVREPLQRLTPNTVTDFSALWEHFTRIRRNGYALDNEERAIGIRGISAPVFFRGRAVASLGLAVPTQRLPAAMVSSMLPLVIEAAANLSKSLDDGE